MKYTSVEDFNYDLPENRIAQEPLEPRDSSKLLVYSPTSKTITDDQFHNLKEHLEPGDLLVTNNTKVIPARMHFIKSTGARIEVFLLHPVGTDPIESVLESKKGTSDWVCMVGNLKKWKDGDTLSITNELPLRAELVEREQKVVRLTWPSDESLASMLEKAGKIPLPPYIKRKTNDQDQERYQTVFAVEQGAVAAPTAGLHFTDNVIESLLEKDISLCPVTLHVGAGTFKPVSTENVFEHDMHEEIILVKKSSITSIKNSTRRIAVGTTSLRTLETLYWAGIKTSRKDENPWHIEQDYPYDHPSDLSYSDALDVLISFMDEHSLKEIQLTTSIMITPHYSVRSIQGIVTNFHLPKSTLIMLIASLVGDQWRAIYQHALTNDYRFLSYGDGSLLFLE